MSGFQGANTTEGGNIFTSFGSSAGTELTKFLLCDDIVPGSRAGYQLCKTIYIYHPLGAKIVETPVNIAQSQAREITVPGGPESKLIPEFHKVWKEIRADDIIKNLVVTSRIYGIASLGAGVRGGDPSQPLDLDKLDDIYFNVFDPLNTAGSLVLDQDPQSPDFQKPVSIQVGDQRWHPSRTVVFMNEKPIYIDFTSSAFGFVGRSAYQRALYPLKTFVETMITDNVVTKKVGLLIWHAKAPGPVTNNPIMQWFGWKRQQLKSGLTGQVLTVGLEEIVESLNFQNLEGPAKFARDNCLKDIAMAVPMPSKLLEQEEMVGGMAEGTEDAKQIASYIDRQRQEMDPIYFFMDRIVQHKAWTPELYKTIQRDDAEWKNVPFNTAFRQWTNSFDAKWPNLLEEPESEKMKVEEIRFKSATAVVEVLAPILDPINKAAVVAWLADEINSRRELFSAKLEIDQKELENYEPPVPEAGGEGGKEPTARPFASNA